MEKMPEYVAENIQSWPWTGFKNKASYAAEIDWPTISIVTPSYNQGKYLEATILSVINQNYPKLEYIIIDGASTDNSVEIIKKYAEKISWWTSEPDEGQADAINKGLAKCTGTLFNWINSDDMLAENALYLLASAYLNNANFKIIAGGCAFMEGSDFLPYTYNKQDLTLLGLITERSYFQQPSQWLNLKEVKVQLNKTFHYSFDWDLLLNIDAKESEILYIDKLLGYFRYHDASKTNNFGEAFKEEKLQSVKLYYKTHKRHRWLLFKYRLFLKAYLDTNYAVRHHNNLLPLLFKNPLFIFSRFYMSYLLKTIARSTD